MKQVFKHGVCLALAMLLPAAVTHAQTVIAVDPAHPRTITVSGESHQPVAPDQAILTLSLTSRDRDLNAAKKRNDELIERVYNICREYNIPKEKIATSNIYI